MLFTNFTQSTSGNVITLKNYQALLNVKDIKFFQEKVSGTFTKKEFRWGFTANHWSNWQALTQENVTCIKPAGRPTLFFEFRYTMSAQGSGTVTSLAINYTSTSSTVGPQVQTTITPPKKVEPTTTTVKSTSEPPEKEPVQRPVQLPPIVGKDPSAEVEEVIDNPPKYEPLEEPVIKTKEMSVVDAQTLDGKSPDFYLWRPYHQGQQEIRTIKGLQAALNNLTNGLQNAIFTGSNVPGDGIGVLFRQGTHTLEFKRIKGGTGITVSEDANGIITVVSTDSVDLSELSMTVVDLSIYVDSKFFNLDTYNAIQDASISLALTGGVGDAPSSYDTIQDTSIAAALSGSSPGVDASIVRIDNYNTIQDASINQALTYPTPYDAIQDASIAAGGGGSAPSIYDQIQDASIAVGGTGPTIYDTGQDASIALALSSGGLDASGTPQQGEIAVFQDEDTLQGFPQFTYGPNGLYIDTSVGIGRYADPNFVLDVSGAMRINGPESGQSTIDDGLIVNFSGGILEINDFQVRTGLYNAIDVSAAGDSISIMDSSLGNIGFFGATPTPQSAGWNATSGSGDKDYVVDATTVNELADVVGTLINELKSKGLLG